LLQPCLFQYSWQHSTQGTCWEVKGLHRAGPLVSHTGGLLHVSWAMGLLREHGMSISLCICILCRI
jgi:hypothetical protein